jgi:hypothetical protein
VTATATKTAGAIEEILQATGSTSELSACLDVA